MDNEQVLKLFSRLKQTQEGIDLLEYLEFVDVQNFKDFKKSDSSMNDIHKGIAIAYEGLIKLFNLCDDSLKQDVNPHSDWGN